VTSLIRDLFNDSMLLCSTPNLYYLLRRLKLIFCSFFPTHLSTSSWAFFVTFGGYFMAHFSRKCYSTVKQQLENTAGYSPLILSEMDTVFMGTYAAGNIISGKLGDTFNPTTVLAIGLFGSGICLFLINISLWFDFLSFSLTLGNFFILAVYFLFGFFQSTGGPVGMLCIRRDYLFLTFSLHNSYLTILFPLYTF